MDGFGTAELKEGVYDRFSPADGAGDRTALGGPYNGFKLFFREDTGLMSPGDSRWGCSPAPDVVVYE